MRVRLIFFALLLLASASVRADAGPIDRFRLVPPDAMHAETLAPLVVVVPPGEETPADGSGARTAFEVLTSATVRRRHPAYILVPHGSAPGAGGDLVDARALESALQAIMDDHPVDRGRVYIVGEYTGADAVWTLLSELPDTFAAGVSLGGATEPEVASGLTDIALWVFHGEHDERVPIRRVRAMIGAIWSAGGVDVRYTEVRDAGNDIRSAAWAESRLLPWLFSQSRE